MIEPSALIKMYSYSFNWVVENVADVTHQNSLWELPSGGNSLNWLLGHLVSARQRALEIVIQPPVWTEVERARYRHGTESISEDADDVFNFSKIIECYTVSQHHLVLGLRELKVQELSQPSGYKDNTLADSLAYFQFHETFHLGEIAMMLQGLGKPWNWV